MALPAILPPGFRFHPTDEELVAFYLHRKVAREKIDSNVIAEIDLYRHDPWELPGLSCLPTKDSEWYFFNPPDKKYPRGSRTNRATKSGYWKATGKDRKVFSNSQVVGMKKTLVFYKGRAPSGERTDWVMHEYQLVQGEILPMGSKEFNDALVLCRVMKKCGLGPRSRNQQGFSLTFHELELASDLDYTAGNSTDLEYHWSHRLADKPGEQPETSRGLPVLVSNTLGDSSHGFGMRMEGLNPGTNNENFSSKEWTTKLGNDGQGGSTPYNGRSGEQGGGAWAPDQGESKEERSSVEVEVEVEQDSEVVEGGDQTMENWNFYASFPRQMDRSSRDNLCF